MRLFHMETPSPYTRFGVKGLGEGGAIAPLMAIRHPDSVASLVSVMATSGRRGLPRPTPEAQAWLETQLGDCGHGGSFRAR